jgi:hypothetical protein
MVSEAAAAGVFAAQQQSRKTQQKRESSVNGWVEVRLVAERRGRLFIIQLNM